MSGTASRDGVRVTLRPVRDGDDEFLRELHADPAVRRSASPSGQSALLPDAGADEFGTAGTVERSLVRARGERVGAVALLGIAPAVGTAEVGYAIHPSFRGNGYATAAVRTVVDGAFADRGLHKLHGFVLATNDASRRVLEAVGFEREGIRRGDVVVDGESVDLHRYGLCARDW